jgi:hypothetical protein
MPMYAAKCPTMRVRTIAESGALPGGQVFGLRAERAEKCGQASNSSLLSNNAAATVRTKSVTVTMRKVKKRRKGVNEPRERRGVEWQCQPQ